MKVTLHYVFQGRGFDYQADVEKHDFDSMEASGETAEDYFRSKAILAFYTGKETPMEAKENETCKGIYICPVCGEYVGAGAKYCTKCGQRINEAKEEIK